MTYKRKKTQPNQKTMTTNVMGSSTGGRVGGRDLAEIILKGGRRPSFSAL
jgi:hypothetical protein